MPFVSENPLPTQSEPLFLASLPDLPIKDAMCPQRARRQVDLILLALEALDLQGAEKMLALTKELELQGVIQNRVILWQVRSTNPLRRSAQRRPMTLTEAKALTLIACHLARRLTVVIRQLLLAHQHLQDKNLSLDHHPRLADYLLRFRVHFQGRMNPKRAAVMAYTCSEEQLNDLALDLLSQLLFCTGTAGLQRLWISLFDGELRC